MHKSFNKFGVLGSVKVRFQYDILRHNACETGTTRKTKRTMKKLATQANRRFIKKLTAEEFKDLIK